jgi:1,3-beta-glucanosyltransferase GAS1
MVASLTCVVDSSVDSDGIADMFDYIYGLADSSYTSGIATNATSGEYGAYSMCDSSDQLSWALNAYYKVQVAAGNGDSACDFSGSATTQSATTSSGSCSTKLAAIGTAGTGSVSGSAATATGTAKSTSTSGSGAYSNAPTAVFVGSWQLGAYIVAALVSGGAMLVL